ncbi:MAG: 50S ribosomal protein L29 [Candidatus Bathyarchaeia archaeon]
MPILRKREIREMPREERLKKLKELRVELTRLKTTVAAGGALDNPSKIREIRKTIARILTIEKEESKRASL